MQHAVSFLQELYGNNKQWFDAHRAEYLKVREKFGGLAPD